MAAPLSGSAQSMPDPKPAEAEASESASSIAIDVSGRVIDRQGRPVRGARVGVESADARVTTDRAGRFTLKAAIGANLVIEHEGHGLGLAVVTGAVLDDIALIDLAEVVETIEISGEAPAKAPGAAVIDRGELQRVPGAAGDVVKALTALPGVVNLQLPLGYSGVVIRGSSPQDSKFLVDDFEIPVLFHNIGFRAVLPAESIASLEYLPGGFGVGIGRASSGIVALTTRPGDVRRSAQAELSLIDGGLIAQGPIGSKTRYMFGLRRSTIDLVLPSLIPADADLSLTTVPSYYDGQLRIDAELSQHWQLAISGLGTIDTFELYATKDTQARTKRFYNRTDYVLLSAAAKYRRDDWFANFAVSGLVSEFRFDAGVFQKIDVTQPRVTPRVEVIRSKSKYAGLTNVEWRIGAEAQVARASIDLAQPRELREGEPMGNFDPKDVTEQFRGKIWTPDFAQWTSLAANLDPRLRATVGLRIDEFARSGEWTLQPRGQVEYKLTPTLTARLSAGAYRRPPEFQSELLVKNLQAERSTQNILGLQYQPSETTRVQASTYYTDRTHLITSEPDGSIGNRGRGRTVGAELLATYRGGPWFTWLAYSYSRSTRVDRPGEPERLFSFDQPHSLNVAASWKRGRWQLGGRFQLYSGLPYTPVRGAVFDSDRNVYVPIFESPNSQRAPIHHQLDVRVDYSWKWNPVALTAFIDVQNVYMNESIVTYFYGYDYTQRDAFKSLPIIPSLGLRGIL